MGEIPARTARFMDMHTRITRIQGYIDNNHVTQPSGSVEFTELREIFTNIRYYSTNPRLGEDITGKYILMHVSSVAFPNDIPEFAAERPKVNTSQILPYYRQGMFVILRVGQASFVSEGMLQEEYLSAVLTVANGYDFPPGSDLALLAEQKNFKIGEELASKLKKMDMVKLHVIMSSNISNFVHNKAMATGAMTNPTPQASGDQHGSSLVGTLATAMSNLGETEGKRSEKKAFAEQILLRDETVWWRHRRQEKGQGSKNTHLLKGAIYLTRGQTSITWRVT